MIWEIICLDFFFNKIYKSHFYYLFMKKSKKSGIVFWIFFLGICVIASNLVSAENLNLKITGEINGC